MVVTLKVPNLPVTKVALAALVMAGAWFSTKVKVWVLDPAVFLAVILRCRSWPCRRRRCPRAWRCRHRCRRNSTPRARCRCR